MLQVRAAMTNGNIWERLREQLASHDLAAQIERNLSAFLKTSGMTAAPLFRALTVPAPRKLLGSALIRSLASMCPAYCSVSI